MILALLIAAGCTDEERFEGLSQEFPKISYELTFNAFRESDLETRTVRNETTGAVLWSPDDAISLFYGSGTNGGSRFVSDATELCDVTNFTGTITAVTGGANISLDDTYFWGVYPYSDDVACDGTYVTLTLPTHQTAVPGTFATCLFPSIARSQGLMMGFYNVCGGWRFSVTKEGIRKVTLKSNGGEMITGKIKVCLNDSGIPAIAEIVDGSDEVVLECPQGEFFEVGRNYYMVLLPTTMASGFTMTFETYTEEGIYNRTASTTIARSGFKGITNIDNYLTTPYALKIGNIPLPDVNFKAYMVENFDTNLDGEISYAEALKITTIDVNTDNISSVQGIECCSNLVNLKCEGGYSISSNSQQYWYETNGNLSSIDLSNNIKLTTLSCSGNQLTDLDLSNNTALTRIECWCNQLTRLNISGCIALRFLYCEANQLTSLDVTHNAELRKLRCPKNKLTSLDVSNNTSLNELVCEWNLLTSLDVSHNSALGSLICSKNQLTSLDIRSNTALNVIWCDGNQLTSLDVSNNTGLISLSCSDNHLTSLDVSNNTELTSLSCEANQLTSLDVSKNTALTNFHCDSNQLTSLDVSNNTALVALLCKNNQLSSIDLSSNTALIIIWCSGNQLTSLDVSNNTALTNLMCSPMNDYSGNNLLGALYIAPGQSIPYVTENRLTSFIPAETEIIVKPDNGGNEGTGDEEVNP